MALEQDIATLSKIPFFADIDTDVLRLIAFGAQKRALDKGDILFRELDEADCGYVIVTGRIGLLSPGALPTQSEKIVSQHGAGELIEEMALITPTNRNCAAICQENADLLRLDRQVFTRMLMEYPQLAISFRQRIEAQLSGVLNKLDKVAHLLEEPDEKDAS